MDSKNKYLEDTMLLNTSTNELSSPFVDEVFFDTQLLDSGNSHSPSQILEQDSIPPLHTEERELDNSEMYGETESYLSEDDEELDAEDDFIDLLVEEIEDDENFIDELAEEIVLFEEDELEEYDDYLDDENNYQEWGELDEADADLNQEEIYETDELVSVTENAEVEDIFELYDNETEVEFGEEESDVELAFEAEYDQDDYDDEIGFDDEEDHQVNYNGTLQEVWNFENKESTPNTAQSLIHNIVRIANSEYANWKNGKLHETDRNAKNYLERYWGTVVEPEGINWRIKQRRPWSAAFISYVVNKAGGRPPFKLSRAHITYARVAKRNRARNKLEEPISMWLHKIQEVKPRVGDILFHSRIAKKKDKTIDRKRTGANYDNISNGNDWATHSDIVVDVDESKGSIYVIGGNVKQSVFKRKRDLDRNGHVKLTGRKLNDFFGILRFFDPNVGDSSSINTLENTRSNAAPKNHYPTLQSASAPSSNSLNSLIHKGKKIYLYGKAYYFAAAAISNGERNANKITDKIFYALYPSKKGANLRSSDPLVKIWKYILNVIVSPMLKRGNQAKPSGTRSSSRRYRLDNIRIPMYQKHYSVHTALGTLTKEREGMHDRPNVPRGPSGDRSGITFGAGIDLTTLVKTRALRNRLVALVAPDNALLAKWIRSVPSNIRGAVARRWLNENPMEGGILDEGQLNQLFEFGRTIFTDRAKRRLLGTSTAHKASPPLTLAEYNDLPLNPSSPENDFIYELLFDLAWNSNHFARGRQNEIADALRVENTGDRYKMQITRLQNLRNFIDTGALSKLGGNEGRWRRLGWIDAKISILKKVQKANQSNE